MSTSTNTPKDFSWVAPVCAVASVAIFCGTCFAIARLSDGVEKLHALTGLVAAMPGPRS